MNRFGSLTLLILCLAAAGCGKNKPAEPPPAVPATTAVRRAVAPPPPTNQAPALSPAPGVETAGAVASADAAADEDPAEFAKQLAEVAKLEAEAQFSPALNLCRKLKSTYRSQARSDELDAIMARLRDARKVALDLSYAVGKLASKHPPTVKVAQRELTQAGETGLIFLRLAVQNPSNAIARSACEALGQAKDAISIPLLIDRLGRERRSDVTVAIMDALRELADKMTDDHLATCYRLMVEDTRMERRELAGLFETLYRNVCKGDAAQFGARLRDPKALDALRAFFERCLVSGNEDLVAFACVYGTDFCGYLHGLRAEYFADTSFTDLAGKGFDANVYQINPRAFAFPGNRQDSISIRWTGRLWIETPGDYTFFANADDAVTVYVDGNAVVAAGPHHAPQSTVNLAAGFHDFRADFVQVGDASWVRVEWAGPGIGRTAELPFRVRPWKDPVLELPAAIRNLASNDVARLRAARECIARRGDAGRLYLRDAVRHGQGVLLDQALNGLVVWRDTPTIPVLLERIRAEAPGSGALPVLTRGLRDLGARIDAATARTMFASFAEDRREMSPYAAGLCGLLDLKFQGTATNFDAWVGVTNGHARLEAHVRAALASTNAESVARACEYGAPFVPLLQGLRGQYFEGEQFDRRVLERLDGTVAIGERAFPMPGNRQDKISARWTGYLHVDKPGDYTFWMRAENNGNLWIDGRHVLNCTFRGNEPSAVAKLTAGLHPLKVEHQQWDGVATISVTVQGPGVERQFLPTAMLRTHPWRSCVEELPVAVAALDSDKEEVLTGAKAHLRAMEPLGRFFLRKALRDGAEAVAVPAANALVDLRDAATAPLLVAKLDARPEAALLRSTMVGLAGVADLMGPAERTALQRRLADDPRFEMGAAPAALCSYLEKACGRDGRLFSQQLQDDRAYGALADYIAGARRVQEPRVLDRLCEFGAPFVPYALGLRGQYFEGYHFDRLILERRDGQCAVDRDQFPHPQNRQDNVSARWTGWLWVEREGDYTFQAWARHHADVWLNGEWIIAVRGREIQKAIKLTKKYHALRVEFRQGVGGERGFSLDWVRPGVGQWERIAGVALQTALWPAEFAPLSLALKAIGSDNPEERAQARVAVHARDPASREALLYVLRHGEEKSVAQALDLLNYRADTNACRVLIERLKRQPDVGHWAAVGTGLIGLSSRMSPADLAWLHSQLKSRTERRMDAVPAALCGVLRDACRADANAYNARVGDPQAYATLKEYVHGCLSLPDVETVLRACELGSAFVGHMPGWSARFFEGWNPDRMVGSAVDAQITVNNRQFPHPQGRYENVCALWDGVLNVPDKGAYRFIVAGRAFGRLWVDGEPVAESWTQEAAKPLDLEKGPHPVRFEYHHNAGESGAYVDWEGPGIQRQRLSGQWVLSPYRAETLRPAAESVKALGAGDANAAAQARQQILAAGNPGVAFLRNAVRHEAEPIAIEAARLLFEQDDRLVADLTVERLRKNPAASGAESLRALLQAAPQRISPENCAWLYASGPVDLQPEHRGRVALLASVLLRKCFGAKDRFNGVAGDPGAYDKLAAVIAQGINSTDDAAVQWACENGGSLAPRVAGLHAQYFEGKDFNTLAVERVDPTIAVAENTFPLRTQNNISARWKGLLRIDKPGEYKFSLRSENLGRVWIDGVRVVEGTNRGQESVGAVQLEPGLHVFAAEFQEWNGVSTMVLSWEGPGVAKQPIPREALSAHVPARVLDELAGIAKGLKSGDENAMGKVRALIANWDPPVRVFLRKALRDAFEEFGPHVIGPLVELQDADSAALLLSRIRANAGFALAPTVLTGLHGLAAAIAPEDRLWLHGQVTADDKVQMGAPAAALCGFLSGACAGDAKKFAAAVKAPDGYERLRDYVAKALRAPDAAVVTRAATFGAPFVPHVPGLRGEYFEGLDFARRYLERIDAALTVEVNKFPHPQRRQDNVSARWTGGLWVETPGDYGFWIGTRHQADVWVAGKLVASARGTDVQQSARLERGLLPIRVEYRQGAGGERFMAVDWWGPNVQRQRLSGPALRTQLSEGDWAALSAGLPDLGSDDAGKVGAARGAFLERDPASRVLLRNALLNAPERVAGQAADLLAFRDDGAAVQDLFLRLESDPGATTSRVVAAALCGLIRHVPAEKIGWLSGRLKADPNPKMSTEAAALCAALQKSCFGSKEKFNKLAGDPAAYDALQTHVARAQEADDAETVLRACEFGAPFVPLLQGWHARFYEGWNPERLVKESAEPQINQENQKFPHPKNRQERVSALWDGLFLVRQSGRYTFRLAGRDRAALWLDGKPVLESVASEAAYGADLEAGSHAIRTDYSHNQGDSYHWLHIEGPDIGRQLLTLNWVRTPLWRPALEDLPRAVRDLGSDVKAQAAAQARLLDAGAAGVALLRRGLRLESDAVAAAACEALRAIRDPQAARLVAARLKKEPQGKNATPFLGALADLAFHLEPEDAVWLNASAPKDCKPESRPHVAALCAVLERKCFGSKDEFNKLVNDPTAYDALASLIGSALASEDKALAAWACEEGGSFAPLARGIRGRYYEGTFFQKSVRESHDGTIQIDPGRFPHPQNRQENVSAQWSGLLLVDPPGDYSFIVTADDGLRLWLDGTLVLDAWTGATAQERRGTVKLTKGLHGIHAAYWQGTQNGSASLQWEGPGVSRRALTGDQLRVHLWRDVQTALASQIKKLGSADPNEVNAARDILRSQEAVAVAHLRNALRYDAVKIMEAAGRLLVEMKDPEAQTVLLQRIKTPKDPAAIPALVEILKPAAAGIKAEDLAAIHESVLTDTDFNRYPLVGLLEPFFADVCKLDVNKFNQTVKNSEGLDRLARYVHAASQSKNKAAAAWGQELRAREPWRSIQVKPQESPKD